MNWYFTVLKKYAVFHGRARRKEFWMFLLINVIIYSILGFFEGFPIVVDDTFQITLSDLCIVLSDFYTLAIFFPSLAVTVRRLHDTNRSGWWTLINLVPIIGTLVLLAFLVEDSQPGENQYGTNPKAGAAA